MASRVVWKGAISFGLVHVPVVLRGASRASRLDFDWLDRRDMAPVGYLRINKKTGKPIESENIVKGYEYQKGEYVLFSDEDFRAANVAATQTVDILSFVDAATIPPLYFDTPYYLEPDRRGDKGYALLRETLQRTGRAGLAKAVIHSKQHLAALLVVDDVLVLNTMRFAEEVLSTADLALPSDSLTKLGIGKRELDMAERLVEEMTEAWDASKYTDTYREDLLERVEAKIHSGQTHVMAQPSADKGERASADIIDLVEVLKRSLDERGGQRKGASSRARPEPPPEPRTPTRARRASASTAKTPAKAPAKASTARSGGRAGTTGTRRKSA
ncbi:Ku protein [Uliginosibacterium sp. sgz301328]|uniref:non-homologous end joining protein Ku n=1 Tax=Uliginosibacterium sp. sgz301328 TaxID=3243764 RepID=UPI00359E35A7